MLNYAAHDVNLFSTDRETVRETRREIRALFETLVNAFRETREDGPAATVAALISRIGYEAARVAIAETIAASSTHDGRIEDRRRASQAYRVDLTDAAKEAIIAHYSTMPGIGF